MSAAAPGISTGLQAATSVFEGFSQANALEGSAAVDQENARLAELEGALATADIRRRGRATQGEAAAALAEGGGQIGSGSASDLLLQNALEIEWAVLSTRFGAQSEARGHMMQAGLKKQAAKHAIIGGFLRAGAAAVTGVEKAMGAKAEGDARQRRNEAYFPGAQQLPLPAGPIHAPNPFMPYGMGR